MTHPHQAYGDPHADEQTMALRVVLPAPAAGSAPADTPAPAPAKAGRDRYLDLLRAVALVRVVVFH
ncbi:acyltransferase family protein, partial [Streptomyces sp. DT225]